MQEHATRSRARHTALRPAAQVASGVHAVPRVLRASAILMEHAVYMHVQPVQTAPEEVRIVKNEKLIVIVLLGQ